MNFQKLSIDSQKFIAELQGVPDDQLNKRLYSYVQSRSELKLPSIPPDLEWLNVRKDSNIQDFFRGKLILLDFFTYCCINCMHILPDLHALEKIFSVSDGLVVLGIHSAKFPNEKLTANILNAVLRYDITHPVLNDPDALLWSKMDIQCWPTFVFVGPDGNVLLYIVGEAHRELLPKLTKAFLDYYRSKDMLQDHSLPIKPEKDSLSTESLLFPGKVCLTNDRKLIISDTGNHRIIMVEPNGVINWIAGGEQGNIDGTYEKGKFNTPQGVCCYNGKIYVADTENHQIRMLDASSRIISTIAGNGRQGMDKEGGKFGKEQELSSPWDVLVWNAPGSTEPEGVQVLYIAMAGTHQLWCHYLEDGPWLKGGSQKATCSVRFSGSGNEENRNNSYPHKASFAQPSGIAIGKVKGQPTLFVADSESSSVRITDIKTGGVKAFVGGDRDPMNLFAFGDEDGKGVAAKLQHPLGVSWDPNGEKLYIADSYNHKIKVADPATNECKSLCGLGQPGFKDGPFHEAMFNEPGGICCSVDGSKAYVADTNNHAIRILDLLEKKVSTLRVLGKDIVDAGPQTKPGCIETEKSIVSSQTPVKVLAPVALNKNEKIKVSCKISLPQNCHYTDEAPSRWRVAFKEEVAGVEISPKSGQLSSETPLVEFELKVSNADHSSVSLKIELAVFFCMSESSICLMRSVVLEQKFLITSNESRATRIPLHYAFE